jgi:hypothetical protein
MIHGTSICNEPRSSTPFNLKEHDDDDVNFKKITTRDITSLFPHKNADQPKE